MYRLLLLLPLLILTGCGPSTNTHAPAQSGWQLDVCNAITKLGYGNWIIVADAAYPQIHNASTQTIHAPAGSPDVVDLIINCMETTQHVRPTFYLPRELRALQPRQAPGIDEHRSALAHALHGYQPLELNEHMLNSLVTEANKTFSALIIKTQTTLPYSSVFIDLDSGYWDQQHEQDLRSSMQQPAR